MRTNGFLEALDDLSTNCNLVLANSKGYVTTPSMAPAVPPAINDLNGSIFYTIVSLRSYEKYIKVSYFTCILTT